MTIRNPALQAITTRYLPATNTRGARISAKCIGGSTTVSYSYSIDRHDNHARAAQALCDKLGWPDDMIGGVLSDGRTYAFVCANA